MHNSPAIPWQHPHQRLHATRSQLAAKAQRVSKEKLSTAVCKPHTHLPVNTEASALDAAPSEPNFVSQC